MILPIEVLQDIFSRLDWADLVQVGMVCSQWRTAAVLLRDYLFRCNRVPAEPMRWIRYEPHMDCFFEPYNIRLLEQGYVGAIISNPEILMSGQTSILFTAVKMQTTTWLTTAERADRLVKRWIVGRSSAVRQNRSCHNFTDCIHWPQQPQRKNLHYGATPRSMMTLNP